MLFTVQYSESTNFFTCGTAKTRAKKAYSYAILVSMYGTFLLLHELYFFNTIFIIAISFIYDYIHNILIQIGLKIFKLFCLNSKRK